MARIEGLGDIIKRLTDAVGVPQCEGCKQRQQWLNDKVPLGKKRGCAKCGKGDKAQAAEDQTVA